MVYRRPKIVPGNAVDAARRGRVVGLFCNACGAVYPQHRSHHKGKPSWGKDHIASPCSHEGDRFEPGEGWWEEAVELLPAPEPEPEEAASS